MKLKNRFLLLLTLTLVMTFGASLPLYQWIQADIMAGLGTRLAEKEVLYNRARVLNPLRRELALAQKLADSSLIKDWARNETDARARSQALRELEEFRMFFQDQSYFFVIQGSGNYYHNNSENQYAGRELRYQIAPGNPEDFWYFATLGGTRPYTLNVDFDENLGVTKVWFNVTVADESRPLGVIGTGLDLSTFLENAIDSRQAGITNIFVEGSGAIQAHPEIAHIDFRTMSKSPDERRTIFQIIDGEPAKAAVAEAMRRLRTEQNQVEVLHAQVDGEDHLIGLSYIREIGWYNVTLMEFDTLLGQELFTPFGILLIATLLLLTAAILLILNRVVLTPIARINRLVMAFAQGILPSGRNEPVRDELGILEQHFQQMAREVHTTTNKLEERVALRTSELLEKNRQLQAAFNEITTLEGMLPICMSCKSIRDEKGDWHRLEEYIGQRSEAEFSHGYCPDCIDKAYSDAGLRPYRNQD